LKLTIQPLLLIGSLVLIGLLGCSGAGPEVKHKPAAPTEMTFMSRTPAVGHYASHAVTVKVTGFERKILEMLAELGKEVGKDPLRVDAATQALAKDVCLGLRADGPPPSPLVTYSMHSQGMISPPPHFVVADVPPGLEDRAVTGLANRVRRVLKDGSFNRVGVALQKPLLTPSRRRLVIALLETSVRLVTPMPRHLKKGQEVALEARVAPAFTAPTLVVAEPRGEIKSETLKVDAAHTLRCTHDGVYQVEITGEGKHGVEVLANFPVYCITPPPADVEYSLAVLSLDTSDVLEEELLELTNGIRQKAGLRTLTLHMSLAAVAKAHSQDMRDDNFVGHNSPTTGRPSERLTRAGVMHLLVRENVARGYSTEEIISGLMNSPAHRGNILAKDVTRIGIGVAVDRSIKPPVIFVTQNFMRPGTAYHQDTARKTVLQLITGQRRRSGAKALVLDEALSAQATKYIEAVTSGKDKAEAQTDLGEALDGMGSRFSQVDSLRVQLKVIEALSQAKAFLKPQYTHLGLGVGERRGMITILILLATAR